MSAVTVRGGRLVASSETIERLKALRAEDEVELGAEGLCSGGNTANGKPEVVFRVNGDDAVEVMLADLMTKAYTGAMQAFRRADAAAEPGQPVLMYEACAGQAARYCRAFAELAVALDRRRGKGHHQRIVVEHVTVHKGGQAIVGAVNR
jgi:hypothetical protein